MNKKMNSSFSASAAIRSRKSVRTYKPLLLPAEKKAELEEFATSLERPFSPRVRLVFLDEDFFQARTGRKIGTYGVIKGARHFIAGVVEKGAKDLEQVGFIFEKLVLYATAMGLGTCWLGGTFKRSGFERAAAVGSSEMLPIVSPVGYEAEKKSFMDSALKVFSGSKKRKPWEELFFNDNYDSPLGEDEAGAYAIPLEMVRLAPSASNKQPWRIVKEGTEWHFFMEYSRLVNRSVGFDIQRVDMGIAMSHFELAAAEEGLHGCWKLRDRASLPFPKAGQLRYIATWFPAPAG